MGRRPFERAGFVGARALASIASLALSGVAAPLARADEVRVQVARDACPSAPLLEQRLAPLLPGVTLAFGVPSQPSPGARSASVNDLGERYTIEIAGLSRELEDPARDCVERARVAAVFIALNLAAKAAPAPAPVPPDEPAPQTEPASEPEAASRLQLGLRLFGDGAYATALEHGALGGDAGAWLGHGALRFALTVGVLSPARVSLAPEPSAVSLLRIPVLASAEYVLRFGPVELGPALGIALDVLRLRGLSLERAQTALRLNPGLLLAADAGLRVSSALLVRLRAHATGFARAYDLRVEPLGPLGRTPRLWLGTSLGLDWQLR